MKTHLSITLLLVLFCNLSWSQTIGEKLETAKQRQESVLAELKQSRDDLMDRNSSELQSELTDLKLELIALINANDAEGSKEDEIQNSQDKINSMQTELDEVLELEQNIAELNAKLEEIGDDIVILQGLAELQEDKDEAERLRSENVENLEDALDEAKLALAQNVNGWLSLSGGLNSLHGTARNLIVFDEDTNEKIGKKLLTGGVDVLTIGFGALGVNAFVNNESDGQKIGFPVLAVIGKFASEFLSKNKKAKQALEGLTRNVVLGDVIYKNEKVTQTLDVDIKRLHIIMFPSKAGVKAENADLSWKPKMEDIQAFRKIVDDINVLYLFLIDIRQAGLILLDSNPDMEEESKKGLEKLTSDIASAQQNWFKSRNIIQPYIKIVEDRLRSNGVQ